MTTATLQSWLDSRPDAVHVPLFLADPMGTVQTHMVGSGRDRRCLCRSPAMEQAVIDLVERGLRDPAWIGMVYIMGWGPRNRFRPLYVGKAGKAGKKPGVISANLLNLRTDKNKFARWGDGGTAYHVGSLSTAIFTDTPFTVRPKYERWAEMLFTTIEPPALRHATSLLVVSWRTTDLGPSGTTMSVEALEEELIDLALAEYDDVVLNVRGETWWAQAAAQPRPSAVMKPRNPVEVVTTATRLAEVCDLLRMETRLGLDVETEWRSQHLCTVQVATPTTTFLIDALAVGDLSAFKEVAEDPRTLKVIHNAAFERRVLRSVGIELRTVYDTFRASERIHGRKQGHNKLSPVCQRELGLPLDKTEQQSAWERRPLTRSQINYAALDAEVMLQLYEALAATDPEHPTRGMFS